MTNLLSVKGAIVQDLDLSHRLIIVSVPRETGVWTFRVDEKAILETKKRQPMKLEEFQLGQRLNLTYLQGLEGQLVAKTITLERGRRATQPA